MSMLRAGLAVAALFFGGVAAFLGLVVTLASLKTGTIAMSYGSGATAVSETIALASDPARFWTWLAGVGLMPVIVGGLVARWGWQRIKGASAG